MKDRELALEALRPVLIGNRVTLVEGHEGGWTLHLLNECFVHIECPWRVIEDGRLKFSASDHEQKFGLPALFNLAESATQLFRDKKLQELSIANEAADLTLKFEGNVRIEILQDSGGYEAWQVKGPGGIFIVAMGGGELAVWNGS